MEFLEALTQVEAAGAALRLDGDRYASFIRKSGSANFWPTKSASFVPTAMM
jgi:hypothetical protein